MGGEEINLCRKIPKFHVDTLPSRKGRKTPIPQVWSVHADPLPQSTVLNV